MKMETTTESPKNAARSQKKAVVPRKGVDTPTLFATINAVKGQPELAEFQFRATNRWVLGTHSESRLETYSGAGGEHQHNDGAGFRFDADHPPVLCGSGKGPTPVEFILHALAACLTAGIGNIASARGVNLTSVESTIEGDINLLGLLGISKTIRNGYQGVKVRFNVEGDAPPEKLREIVEQSRARSAVFDVITNGVPVDISVVAE
jgi:uncharacterized OsmC-like protein